MATFAGIAGDSPAAVNSVPDRRAVPVNAGRLEGDRGQDALGLHAAEVGAADDEDVLADNAKFSALIALAVLSACESRPQKARGSPARQHDFVA